MRGTMTWTTLASAGGGYLLFLLLLFAAQRSLMYHPDVRPPEPERLAAAGFTTIETQTADGLELRHLYRPPKRPGAPLLVLFHGNAGRAGDRIRKFDPVLGREAAVLLAEYRGFGGNPGWPSESGLLEDGRSLVAWLQQQGIGADRLILYGESLGGGVAVPLAAELARRGTPVAAVALEAPFSSMADAAQFHFWYAPARLLVRDRYDSLAHIAGIGAPLLVLHGELDRTVPVRLGRRLYEAAREPKEFLEVPGAGHVDLYSFDRVAERLRSFLHARAIAGG